MIQHTKNQHFVPQFYLKNFLDNNNVLQVLSAEHNKIINSKGTKGICYEKYFYGLETGKADGTSQEIETMFTELETNLSQKIPKIISKIRSNQQIKEEEKWVVSLMMSMIWIRVPSFRQSINSTQEDVTKDLLEFQSRYDTSLKGIKPLNKEDYSLKFNNSQHLKMFPSIPNFANLFCAQYWTIYISQCDYKFITSDNPISTVVPEKTSFYGPVFSERKHIFALTPDICIVAKNPKHVTKSVKRKTLFKDNIIDIFKLNATIANRVHQYAYGNRKEELEDLISDRKLFESRNAMPPTTPH